MRIYLDNCSFNRPFDNQEFIRIKIETEAKLYIQEKIKEYKIELVWSYILDYENSINPFEERKKQIEEWKKYSIIDIIESENIIKNAENLYNLGIKAKDALHIACAVESNCEYFITTDDYLIKKSNEIKSIRVVSPTMFIEMEDIE